MGGEGIFLEEVGRSPTRSKPHPSWKERAVRIDFQLLLCLSSLPQCQQGASCPCSFFWCDCGREGCLSRATSFLLLRHQQPSFLIGQTEAQKNGQGLPWRHDTSRARSCPILSPVLTLGKCSFWIVTCRRTGGPRPSCLSLRHNFSRCLAADTCETTCRNEGTNEREFFSVGTVAPVSLNLQPLSFVKRMPRKTSSEESYQSSHLTPSGTMERSQG